MNTTVQNVIRRLVSKLPVSCIPVERKTVQDSRSETPSMAPGLSVDLIHSAISEAQAGSTRNLFALYRDMILSCSHLQAEITKRKLAVLGDALQYMAFDKKNADDVDAAMAIDSAVGDIRGWIRGCAFLLDSSLWPVTVVEKVYRSQGGRYAIDQLIPVPYQLLDFTSGRLMIFDADPYTGSPMCTKHDPDPNRYIVHRGHLLSSPDNWGGPMRSVLFWWLLATQDREWLAKFLERFGSPFMVGKYRDNDGRTVLMQAFSLATRLGGLVISDETDVEIKEASTSNDGKAFQMFHDICEREMSKLVLGQTLSAEARSTGMNSGVANMQEEVRQDIRKFDARVLAETLRDQLFKQYLRINGMAGNPPTLLWGSDSQGVVDGQIALLQAVHDAGLEVSDESLYAIGERVGLQLQRSSVPLAPPPFTPRTFSMSASG